MDSYHLPIFGGHWSNASGDRQYLIYNVTSQIHVIEGSSSFLSGSSSFFMVCHEFAKFGDHRYCGNRDIMFLVSHLVY